jgi:hypothetical protein
LRRGVESEARDFTPFTPYSGFSVQALISRWFAIVRMHSRGRIWSLFSIAYQIPKLDVAGSTPVSRSIFFNDLYTSDLCLEHHLNTVKKCPCGKPLERQYFLVHS